MLQPRQGQLGRVSTQPLSLTHRFGEVVHARRRRLGWTQEELAEKAGLHRNHVGHIERGEKSPTLASVEAICQALGERPSALLEAAGS